MVTGDNKVRQGVHPAKMTLCKPIGARGELRQHICHNVGIKVIMGHIMVVGDNRVRLFALLHTGLVRKGTCKIWQLGLGMDEMFLYACAASIFPLRALPPLGLCHHES
eukprot:scaffold15050_cov17-Tisochrysis_lutea.AAC.1